MLLRLSLLFTLLLSLSACSLLPEDEDKTKNWSAQKIYTEATAAMNDGSYKTAIEYYETLQSRYPFGPLSTQSQLNISYTHYRDGEPESAIIAADRFIKLNPDHPALAYAYYLKGLVNFNRNLGFFDRFIPTDDSQRDPGATTNSFKDFTTLIEKFPKSKYAADAVQRMVYLRNNLAKHEIHVAKYYITRGAYVAAANRAKYTIENYQRTRSVKDALDVLVIAYGPDALDQPKLIADAQRVIALNQEKGTFEKYEADKSDDLLIHTIWDYLGLDKN